MLLGDLSLVDTTPGEKGEHRREPGSMVRREERVSQPHKPGGVRADRPTLLPMNRGRRDQRERSSGRGASQDWRRRAYAAAARPRTSNPFGSGTGAGRIVPASGVAAEPPPDAARPVAPMPTVGSGRSGGARLVAHAGVKSLTRTVSNVAASEGNRVEVGRPLAAPRGSGFRTRRSSRPAARVAEFVVPVGEEIADGPDEIAALPAIGDHPSAWFNRATPTA